MISMNKKIIAFLNSRNMKYGSFTLIMIAIVVAAAVFVNLLVGLADVKWDLTANQLFSLGDTSKKILEGLEKEVTIYGLFDKEQLSAGDEDDKVADLVTQYGKYPKVTVEYVDPDRNPGFINDLDKQGMKELQKGNYVVKCGNKLKKLTYEDIFTTQIDYQTFNYYITGSQAEQAFTGAIKYVTADVTPTVYFTEGHGENSVESEYTNLTRMLGNNNYDVKTLQLLTEEKVPDNAEMLIIASPKKDLTPDERARLQEYLRNGGKAIFMFDSLESNTDFKNFENVLNEFNISLNYDKIKENDPTRRLPHDPYVILLDVAVNDIIKTAYNVVLQNSRSINILKNEKQYVKTTPLIMTSSQAVGEQIDKSKGADLNGPLYVGAAVEHTGQKNASRILVMGNSSFVSDDAAQRYGDMYVQGVSLFFSSMDWLRDKTDDLRIEAKSFSPATIEINSSQQKVLTVIVVAVLPLLILGSGMYVYLRRRHL